MINLTKEIIEFKLKKFQNWKYELNFLTKEFSFENYLDGIEFAKKVGIISESINHHPKIIILWRKVILEIFTHDTNGITELDFKLIEKIENTIEL